MTDSATGMFGGRSDRRTSDLWPIVRQNRDMEISVRHRLCDGMFSSRSDPRRSDLWKIVWQNGDKSFFWNISLFFVFLNCWGVTTEIKERNFYLILMRKFFFNCCLDSLCRSPMTPTGVAHQNQNVFFLGHGS